MDKIIPFLVNKKGSACSMKYFQISKIKSIYSSISQMIRAECSVLICILTLLRE